MNAAAWDRARRLASDLSDLLNEVDGGSQMVEIFPSKITGRPAILWGDVDYVLRTTTSIGKAVPS